MGGLGSLGRDPRESIGILGGLLVLQACASAPADSPAPRAPGTSVAQGGASLVVLPAQSFQGPEICFNATDDNQNLLIDEGCEVRQGQIHVMVAWLEADADIDLFVTDPSGRVGQPEQDDEGGLVLSGDCPDVDRACPSHRFESVHGESAVPDPGVYSIRVRLERVPEAALDRPIEARLGVRTPTHTTNYLASFWEPGQEVRLRFVVRPSDHEPPDGQAGAGARRQAPKRRAAKPGPAKPGAARPGAAKPGAAKPEDLPPLAESGQAR